ncbi:hypothetical protein [Agathobaculum sp. Marseille-P7918]|uniref:hypothetical protein n=1 Tax=Agathobaculum sp. Marseille-P7918 TaxID=2479843 RepID=UPI003562B13D
MFDKPTIFLKEGAKRQIAKLKDFAIAFLVLFFILLRLFEGVCSTVKTVYLVAQMPSYQQNIDLNIDFADRGAESMKNKWLVYWPRARPVYWQVLVSAACP